MTAKELLDGPMPGNLDAEKDVLGSIFLMPSLLGDAERILAARDFSELAHQKIFRAMQACWADSGRIDPHLVLARLDLEHGKALVAEIVSAVPTAANLTHYAHIVRDKSLKRDLIHAATETLRDAYADEQPSSEVLSAAEARIFAAGSQTRQDSVTHVSDALMAVMDELQSKGNTFGLPTGFWELDRMTGGWHPGELTILAGRPGHGKTSVSLQLAEHVAKTRGVLFVSLEMNKGELTKRMLSRASGVNGMAFRSRELRSDESRAIAESASQVASLKLTIDDSPTRTAAEVASISRHVASKEPIGLLVVDYIGLMKPEDSRQSKVHQLDDMGRALKVVARELECSVLCLAQLNRAVDARPDKIPLLSDLRDSGALEQHADNVMFVFRPEKYLTDEQKRNPTAKTELILGKTKLILSKQRNGDTGEITLEWDGPTTSLVEITPEVAEFDADNWEGAYAG